MPKMKELYRTEFQTNGTTISIAWEAQITVR